MELGCVSAAERVVAGAGRTVRLVAARTLITGGVRSGKSSYAETLLADAPSVTYVAPGPVPDPAADPEWAARVHAHQAARPAHWQTVETGDLVGVLDATAGAVLVDCLGTWLTRWLDERSLWDHPRSDWLGTFDAELDRMVAAWRAAAGPVIAVTNEVGWGVVPAYASGRLFADLLGRVNQRLASASDRVVLMVMGRVVEL